MSLSWYRHTQLVFSGGLAPLAAQRGTGTEQQGGPPLGAGDGLALTACLQSALWRTWRQNLNLTRVVDALAGAVKGKQILEISPRYTRWRQNLGKKTATTLSPPTPKTVQQQRPMKDGRCSEQTKEPFM